MSDEQQRGECPYCGDGICTLCLRDMASKEYEDKRRSTNTVTIEITPAAMTLMAQMFNPEVYEYFDKDDRLS